MFAKQEQLVMRCFDISQEPSPAPSVLFQGRILMAAGVGFHSERWRIYRDEKWCSFAENGDRDLAGDRADSIVSLLMLENNFSGVCQERFRVIPPLLKAVIHF
jgi:hypothetical protein